MNEIGSREAQNIEELLPWYEKGTLSAAEMRRVEDYLGTHPEMQFRLSLIREELAETIAANEALGMPSGAARERLFAAIAAEAGPARARTGLSVWWRGLLPDGVSPRLGLAAAAACLVIALQAAALVVFSLAPPDNGFRVAAGREGSPAQPGSDLLIRFTDDAKAGDIAALLKEMNAIIVDGPKPGGVFKVRIGGRALTEEEREAAIRKLREKSDMINFVAPSG